MSAEQLLFDGKRVLIKTMERAARADSGVIIDYLRFTIKRQVLHRLQDLNLTDDDNSTHNDAQITRWQWRYNWCCRLGRANGQRAGQQQGFFELFGLNGRCW